MPKAKDISEVKNNIVERLDEAVADIQHLLEAACCNNCKKCEYSYLCADE